MALCEQKWLIMVLRIVFLIEAVNTGKSLRAKRSNLNYHNGISSLILFSGCSQSQNIYENRFDSSRPEIYLIHTSWPQIKSIV